MSSRPASGVRYALERTREGAEHVLYEGFVHLPDAEDLPATAQVALPGGAVRATVAVSPDQAPADEARAAAFAKTMTALVRAATKAEVAAGQTLPRKIVRWRG